MSDSSGTSERDEREPSGWLTYPRLIGARLEGYPPLGPTYIDLTPGLSVLYGRNGAGKSTLLNALAEAIRGNRCPAADHREILFAWKPPAPPTNRWGHEHPAPQDWLGIPSNPWNRPAVSRDIVEYFGKSRNDLWESEHVAGDNAPPIPRIEAILHEELEAEPASVRALCTAVVLRSDPDFTVGEWAFRLLVRSVLEAVRQGSFTGRSAGVLSLGIHASISASTTNLQLAYLLVSVMSDKYIPILLTNEQPDAAVTSALERFTRHGSDVASWLPPDGHPDLDTDEPDAIDGAQPGGWSPNWWASHVRMSGL